METRRRFLGKAMAAGGLLLFGRSAFPGIPMRNRPAPVNAKTAVYRAVNGTPAENSHRGSAPLSSQSSGWVRPFERNSDLPGVRNMGECAARLKEMFGKGFSTRAWINVGSGGRRVHGPDDGIGYVYCDGTGGV